MDVRYVRVSRRLIDRLGLIEAAGHPALEVSMLFRDNYYVRTDEQGVDAVAERLRQRGIDHEVLTPTDVDVDVDRCFLK